MDAETGRRLWAELHAWAAGRPEVLDARARVMAHAWLAAWSRRIPRGPGCHCASEWPVALRISFPDLSTRAALVEWTTAFHDRINARLGKPLHDARSARHPLLVELTARD